MRLRQLYLNHFHHRCATFSSACHCTLTAPLTRQRIFLSRATAELNGPQICGILENAQLAFDVLYPAATMQIVVCQIRRTKQFEIRNG